MSRALENDGGTAKETCIHGDPPQLKVKLPSIKDVAATVRWRDAAPLPVDILLLTVKDCEFLACYSQLVKPFKCWFQNVGFVYFEDVGEGLEEKLNVALLKCNEGSIAPGSSLRIVISAAAYLRPKAVISVGACSSLNPQKAKLGDVVVSWKLTTINQEQPTSMRAIVSSGFLSIIGESCHGYQAPLQNQQAYDIKVHRDAELLTGPELVCDKRRRQQLAEIHPHAIAIEMEGEGVFAATFDGQIEWLIVKGIADYADGDDLTTQHWSPFASVMAVSLVKHILRAQIVFRTWPNYCFEGVPHPTHIIKRIRQIYKRREGRIFPVPWNKDFSFHLKDIFSSLRIVGKDMSRVTQTDEIIDITGIFTAHSGCQNPETVLIEGEPGIGKTTLCKKLAYDWATKEDHEWNKSFPKTEVLLLLRCRDIKSNLFEAIDEQLLPEDADKETKEMFFQFIRENSSKVMLVLDGLDDMDSRKVDVYKLTEQLSGCHSVLTSRDESGKRVIRYCDTLWEIVGFTKENAESLIRRYFQKKQHMAETLIEKIWPQHNKEYDVGDVDMDDDDDDDNVDDDKGLFGYWHVQRDGKISPRYSKDYDDSDIDMDDDGGDDDDDDGADDDDDDDDDDDNEGLFGYYDVQRDLRDLMRNPMHASLLCVIFDDSKGVLPDSRTGLFIAIVLDVLRRYESVKGLSSNCKDLIAVYKIELMSLGYIALQSLRKGEFHFEDNQSVITGCGLDKFGFLSSQAGGTKREQCILYGFSHKSFQEFFSGFYLAFQILDGKRDCASVIDELNLAELNQVILFVSGIVASRCEKTAESLIKSMVERINCEDRKSEIQLCIYLACDSISECAASAEEHSRLAHHLGKTLNRTDLDLSEIFFNSSRIATFSLALKGNSTLNYLNLGQNYVGAEGATCLSKALTVNSSLTHLSLDGSSIDEEGASSLSQALAVNATLSTLNVRANGIGKRGATSLSRGLRKNSTLTKLNLSNNNIGYEGAISFSRALTANSTLTNLNLSGNSIGDEGATSLSQALGVNSSLIKLKLCCNGIGDEGATSLSQALTANSTLTKLTLTSNFIGNKGATSLSQALLRNSTLTELNLEHNRIDVAGITSLNNALALSFTLTYLNL